MHTKKRNRLLHKRLNAIVFISYNRKMKTRFQMLRQKKKNIDPLVISDLAWDNEWADSLHEPPQGRRGSDLGDGLTWELVDGATGASQSLQGRCFPRRAHRNSRGDPIVYKRGRSRTATIDEEDEIDDQEEEHLGSDNEEREQDDDDDENVTDNEDSPTNVAAETTNDAPTNEFDDGY